MPLAAQGSRETGVTVDVSAARSRPCWLVAETPRTFIELEAAKFHGHLEHEGLTEAIRTRMPAGLEHEPGREIYSKYVKIALNHADGRLRLGTDAVGLPIEIVPLLDADLSVGAALPVRVLIGGRPGAGLQLRVSYRESERAEPSADAL